MVTVGRKLDKEPLGPEIGRESCAPESSQDPGGYHRRAPATDNFARLRTTSQSCPYGCKKILRIRASNIDSGSSPDAQCRFKNWCAVIRLLRPRRPPPAFATISASSGHSLGPRGRTGSTGSAAGRERGKVATTDAGHHQSRCTTAPSCSAWRSWIAGKGHRKDRALRSPRALRRARLHRVCSPRDPQGAG